MPRGLGGGGGGEVLQGVQAEDAFRQRPANVQVREMCCLEKNLWELVVIFRRECGILIEPRDKYEWKRIAEKYRGSL